MRVMMLGGPRDGEILEVPDGVDVIHVPDLDEAPPLIATRQPHPEPPVTRGDLVVTRPHRRPPPEILSVPIRDLPIARRADGARVALWNGWPP